MKTTREGFNQVTEIKTGDRVKVTIHEAVVTHAYGPNDIGLDIEFNHDTVLLNDSYLRNGGATVEKIEPPVWVFSPGDVVRSKSSGHTYAITHTGWVPLHDAYGELGSTNHATDCYFEFTSQFYEKVEVAA